MKSCRTFIRSLRDAFKSVVRNFSLSLASVTCITITLIIIAAALLISENVRNFTDEIEKDVSEIIVEEDTGAYDNDDSSYEVLKVAKDAYIVTGGKIKRLTSVTDDRNRQQILRLQNILKSMGVFDELRKKGVKDGDTVVIGHLEMEFYEDEY